MIILNSMIRRVKISQIKKNWSEQNTRLRRSVSVFRRKRNVLRRFRK